MHELMAERAELLMVEQTIIDDDEPQRIAVQAAQSSLQLPLLHAHIHRFGLRQQVVVSVYRPSPPFISASLSGSVSAATS